MLVYLSIVHARKNVVVVVVAEMLEMFARIQQKARIFTCTHKILADDETSGKNE